MSLKPVIITCAAVMTISLSGAPCAQPAPVIEGGTVVVPDAGTPIVEDEAADAPVAEEPSAAVTAAPASSAPPTANEPAAIQAAEDEAAAAQDYKRMKMDAATAADDRFHADRTQANMIARDRAEAEAAAAIGAAHDAEDRARAAKERAARAGNPR